MSREDLPMSQFGVDSATNPDGTGNGLNLDEPDRTTQAEWDAFRRQHGMPFGHPDGLPAWTLFWPDRPDVIKRWRRFNRGGYAPKDPEGWDIRWVRSLASACAFA